MNATDPLVGDLSPNQAETKRASAGKRSTLLIERFRETREFTTRLCRTLKTEDYVVQSMPDVSPIKWHLAHTTWFFETFLLKVWREQYRPSNENYAYLFNSYYNAAGDMHRRDLRGLISRPTVTETHEYREAIDQAISQLIQDADDELLQKIEPVLILGLHHEQQHQELLLTDVKHVFAQNPLYPVFQSRPMVAKNALTTAQRFLDFDEAIVTVGHSGSGFSYDNEGPQHRVLVPAFSLSNRLVTNAEYLKFIEAEGYKRPEFWLSVGWTTVNEQGWKAPLYWAQHEGAWWNFTLSGFRPVVPSEPVTHVSYFEADAYAAWSGARLPTEFEWEQAASSVPIEGNFVDSEQFHPMPAVGQTTDCGLLQMFGDAWEWTRSGYLPYPGYHAGAGALGEYNGKFMCNQMVLRGGSCATSRSHIRPTYRNFFQPEKRWQFTGIRLARDPR